MEDRFTATSYSIVSDHSDNSSEDLTGYPQNFISSTDVCRDFLRNSCQRGNACKYRHPDEEQVEVFSEDVVQKDLTFCHDYQNKGCNRSDCRFVHCSREEEDVYRRSGILPRLCKTSSFGSKKMPPICMDFMNGFCKRGQMCKYRHLLPESSGCSPSSTSPFLKIKKRKFQEDRVVSSRDQDKKFVKMEDFQEVIERNSQLKKRIENLERQLSVLVASNELLLEQNARYRSCKLITVPPIVAVSQMLTPTVTPATVASRPLPTLHHQTPHGITTMATLSIAGSQREFVLPPLPPTQQSLPSQPTQVDQNIPLGLSMAPCTNFSNSALSQQPQPQNLNVSLSMPLPPHSSLNSLIQNSNLPSYPLISHARLPTSSLG